MSCGGRWRCCAVPDGVGANCFVQKHAHATFDRNRILRVDDDGEEIIAIDDLAGLVALVQAGVLEVHVWGTTIDHIDLLRPPRVRPRSRRPASPGPT